MSFPARSGPEAGVWVIAETTDLPTRYIKEVVTDDQGRYLIPALPAATYTVWARGYGLVDSPKVQAARETDRSEAFCRARQEGRRAILSGELLVRDAEYPEGERISGHGTRGNGISTNIKTQGQWLHLIKTDSCESCHQLGNEYTRTIPALFSNFDSPAKAWMRRVQSGQAGRAMVGGLTSSARKGPRRSSATGPLASQQGELPAEAPPRPQGIERNIVITQWDWADPKAYLHDEISTDKRNPAVNANGLIYGSPEESRDYLPVLDPVTTRHQPGEGSVSRSGHAGAAEAAATVRQSGATKPFGTATRPCTIRCSMSAAGSGTRRESGRRIIPPSAKRVPICPSAKLTPVATFRTATGGLRSGNEADVHDRHLLQHPSSGVRVGCE